MVDAKTVVSNKNFKKIALLILAHKNINQLIRLLKKFDHEAIDIFVHLDSKWDLSKEQVNSLATANNKDVYICNNRISAKLDTWSLVEATMELIKESKQAEMKLMHEYRYFALLSGQDYPVKKISSLLNLLNKSYPKPFIDCTPYDRNNIFYGKFNKLPVENTINMFVNNRINPGLIRIIVKLPILLIFSIIKLFYSNPYKKLSANNYKLYGGSAWWVLPDIAIDEVLKKYDDRENEVNLIFKGTLTPEETYFQTVVMQSKIANLVDKKAPQEIYTKYNLTYSHFRPQGKPFTGHPYILTVSDYYEISNLPHCFARKFDEYIDTEIMDMIDSNILKNDLNERNY